MFFTKKNEIVWKGEKVMKKSVEYFLRLLYENLVILLMTQVSDCLILAIVFLGIQIIFKNNLNFSLEIYLLFKVLILIDFLFNIIVLVLNLSFQLESFSSSNTKTTELF